MLEKQDLQKIEKIVERGVRVEVGKIMESNIIPAFDGIYKRFDGVDKRFDGIDKRFDGVDKRLDNLDKRLTSVESQMVTKSYLTDKLADLEGSVIVRQRKEDEKFKLLVKILHKRNTLTSLDVKMLDEIQLFPRAQRV